MKKCPHCSAINREYDPVCGVCGESLSGVSSENLVSLEAETLASPRQPPPPRERLHPRALLALTIGVSIMGLGFYMFVVSGPIGLFLLLGGVAVVASAFGIRGSAPEMGGRGKTGFRDRRGQLADLRTESEEAIKEERREKGRRRLIVLRYSILAKVV